MRISAAASILSVLAILFAIAGCGGSDSDSSTSVGVGESSTGGESALSKAAFLKKADAICEASQNRIIKKSVVELREALSEGQPKGEVEANLLATLVIPTLETEVEELRALGAPQGDEAKVSAIVDATQEVVDEANAKPETFLAGKQYRRGHYDKAYELASEYGLTACPQT